MKPLLSILTLTIPERTEKLAELRNRLDDQIESSGAPHLFEHLIFDSPEVYGDKMRKSAMASSGEYLCWLDDDDLPGYGYISRMLRALSLRPDVVTLTSQWLGCGRLISYRANYPEAGMIRRPEDNRLITEPAQHFCAWRRRIALSAPWLPYGYGAEVVWRECLNRGYPNLSEVHINKPVYLRRWSSKDSRCQRPQDSSSYVWRYAGGLDCFRTADGHLLASLCGRSHRTNTPGETVIAIRADGTLGYVDPNASELLTTVLIG